MASLQERIAAQGPARSVFSRQKVVKYGTGETTRKAVQKCYYFATRLDEERFELRPLDADYKPAGTAKDVTLDELLRAYQPEPELYCSTVLPRLLAEETGRKAASTVDENNVRCTFHIGLSYLEKGDRTRAVDIMGRIAKLPVPFQQAHKHLFNELGMALRRAGLLEEAVLFYTRALEFAAEDEHLHFNTARAHLELGNLAKAREHVEACIRINPGFEPAAPLLRTIISRTPAEPREADPGDSMRATG